MLEHETGERKIVKGNDTKAKKKTWKSDSDFRCNVISVLSRIISRDHASQEGKNSVARVEAARLPIANEVGLWTREI